MLVIGSGRMVWPRVLWSSGVCLAVMLPFVGVTIVALAVAGDLVVVSEAIHFAVPSETSAGSLVFLSVSRQQSR